MTTKNIIALIEATATLNFEDKGKYIELLGLIATNQATTLNVYNKIGNISSNLSKLIYECNGYYYIKTKKENNSPELLQLVKEVIDFLNVKASRRLMYNNKTTIDLIKNLFYSGYRIDDFKTVINNKCLSWLDTPQSIFLRPETLFGSKFESYLNERPTKTSQPQITDKPFGELSNKTL